MRYGEERTKRGRGGESPARVTRGGGGESKPSISPSDPSIFLGSQISVIAIRYRGKSAMRNATPYTVQSLSFLVSSTDISYLRTPDMIAHDRRFQRIIYFSRLSREYEFHIHGGGSYAVFLLVPRVFPSISHPFFLSGGRAAASGPRGIFRRGSFLRRASRWPKKCNETKVPRSLVASLVFFLSVSPSSRVHVCR